MRPSTVISARIAPSGELVVEFDKFVDWKKRPAVLVLPTAELDVALSGPPIESTYRLPVPHALLRRSRFLADMPRDLPSGGTPVPVLTWENWYRDGPANPFPEASAAPLAVAWDRSYRTGRNQRREALFVQRNTPAGRERAVFLVEEYEPRSWDLAARVVLFAADVVLIASRF